MNAGILKYAVACLLVAIPMLASAAAPNIDPGQWRYKNEVQISAGDQTMPSQTIEDEECVRKEDVANADFFASEELEECDVSDVKQSRSRLRYTLNCAGPEGESYTMTADVKLKGSTMEGTIRGEMESPMGPMRMHMKMSGKRIGDC